MDHIGLLVNAGFHNSFIFFNEYSKTSMTEQILKKIIKRLKNET